MLKAGNNCGSASSKRDFIPGQHIAAWMGGDVGMSPNPNPIDLFDKRGITLKK